MTDIAKIAAGLTKAQRAALLAFPEDISVEMANGIHLPIRLFRKASEVGVSGNTLASMNPLGGVDPADLGCGPILFTADWSREGRYWSMTDIGIAVRDYLKEQQP
jgi:hypothetical protein